MTDPVVNLSSRKIRFAWRMAVFYAALFLVYGIHVSYFPVWLNWRGLSDGEIGVITA